MKPTWVGALTIAALCAFGSNQPVLAQDAKSAAKQTDEAFDKTHFVAKMPLVRYAHLYVLPDGAPSDKKGRRTQGVVGAGTIQFGDPVKVREGEVGESIKLYVKGKELIVGLNKKRGARMNPTSVHVLYGRPVTASDITPHKIARALSGVVEIKGYEPGSEVDAAFASALEGDPTAGLPDRPIGPPTVLAVSVTAEPGSVRPGDEVVFQLSYQVQTPGATAKAVESVDLKVAGASVPGYPRTATVERELPPPVRRAEHPG